jgi:site-specific DNA recombinase
MGGAVASDLTRGKPFATSNVHRILTDETYTGTHWFNVRDSKTGKVRPRSDWVAMETPVIIDPAMFDRVRARRADHHPRNTPPRVVTGPILSPDWQSVPPVVLA